MNERLRQLRRSMDYTQEEFAKKIGIKRNTLANYETGRNEPIDAVFFSICREFDVNEEWLRTGEGEMFIQASEFSLNEYAEKNNLSELEFDILRGYMELDSDIRKKVLSYFKTIFNKHSEVAATIDNSIDEEVESYRLELEAEQKGETSSALEELEEKLS